MQNSKPKNLGRVGIVGAGLAGSEAAYFLASRGVEVHLFESKRIEKNPAQKDSNFAELVCTNSLKSKEPSSAHGLLKEEMRALGSVVLKVAAETAVPAGAALAVDRSLFSEVMTSLLSKESNITIHDLIVSNPQTLKEEYQLDHVILATGPLTMKPLEDWIASTLAPDDLYFYDAIAPVVDAESLDLTHMYFKDRYDKAPGQADYLNVPLNKEQYEHFVDELIKAEKVPAKNFEEMRFFEACLPIDIMAERGVDTLRFSCMKPVGLEAEDGKLHHAVIQLRKENLLGSSFNLVGFQNRLTYGEQARIFKMLPGFENASFNKLGSVHRNTFINAKKLLELDFSTYKFPWLSLAGQITGVEGYTESASMGLYVAFQILRKLQNLAPVEFPVEMGIGALVNYVRTVEKPSPSSINFGLFPEIEMPKVKGIRRGERKSLKKDYIAKRALDTGKVFFKYNLENML
jgi:methylenetetrahydrofolate--tRNA-(uracil-5-)-methyltransferase